MTTSKKKSRFVGVALALVVGLGAWTAWRYLQPAGLPEGFASGNGRIEAREVIVATKAPGRIAEILVDEGDVVTEGQVLARMDTAVLRAQLAQAKAQARQAQNAQNTAALGVAQRESVRVSMKATVEQRQAEVDVTTRRFERTESLARNNAVAQQTLDDDRATMLSARAALAAAQSQVIASEAAIAAAQSQVIEAESAAEAAKAAVDALTANIAESELIAPRSGRVQYRISHAGEVLGAGGPVLSLVDLSDVYMTFFLPTIETGQLAHGSEARIVLNAWPQFVIPARISFVANVAQFTPRTVETANERDKLMFRVRAQVDPELLRRHADLVKTGLPGVAYVRLDPQVQWPAKIQVKLPE